MLEEVRSYLSGNCAHAVEEQRALGLHRIKLLQYTVYIELGRLSKPCALRGRRP